VFNRSQKNPTLKIPLRAFRLYKTFGFKHS
jgi:hypothetical protein